MQINLNSGALPLHPFSAVLCMFCVCLCVQEDCAEKQVYIRRLEAKLQELQGAADIASKYQSAKQKVGYQDHIHAVIRRQQCCCALAGHNTHIRAPELPRALGTIKNSAWHGFCMVPCVQVQEQQQQLAALTAELQATKEQATQQQKDLDKANRYAQTALQHTQRMWLPRCVLESSRLCASHCKAPPLCCTVCCCHRALDIRVRELSQEFGGSDDVPAQLLHSLAGVCAWLPPFHRWS
jgi:hypothetical protein